MKTGSQFLWHYWHTFKKIWHPDIGGQPTEVELPLRAELFSALQMEQYGRILAGQHQLGTQREDDQLLSRLADNEHVIITACSQLTAAIKAGRQITPAAEWLLDNFYLIEEQIRTAKRHLPKNYSKELPRLLLGQFAGRPRVYDIALETIAHGDGRVDPESLRHFVVAYQQVTTLKLGELWAIPIMLRLALIENLRRVASRLAMTRLHRNLAHTWADAMMEVNEKDPANLILLVADMARSNPPMESAFVAEMVRRLQAQSPSLALPLTWLVQHLAEAGQTIEHLVQIDTQRQAADQVSISNSIGSLRCLSTMDWRDFVESTSAVEYVLSQDPAQAYSNMDFATRDQYRHVVERLARGCHLSETDVANKAIELAKAASIHDAPTDKEQHRSHVGYYLIGKGLPALKDVAGCTTSVLQVLQRTGRRFPLSVYLGSIFLICITGAAVLVAKAYDDGAENWLLALFAVLAVISTSQLAVSIVNWAATLAVQPKPLPRMDFSRGIPDEFSALVVVPTMLFTTQGIDDLAEALEVRFLANRDESLSFCLLTDLSDAAIETLPEDAALLSCVQNNIMQLNKKYPRIGGDNFLLLHRPRRWNPQEEIWMGYERKRGKLGDLNAFLRGGAADAFSCIVGNTARLPNVKYVITLDTDTDLPRDAARLFVATMAHPLNQAQYDGQRDRIVDGYGILQPRVAVGLPDADASRYALLCGGETGIDPYTRTVSDVYQDLFGEGSFTGKGIYDVDAFEHVLKDRMPENRILSHDLLEGCYARSGLLSDAQVYEKYPSRYSADVSRRHRWIRGDWQIASWLLPSVPATRDANGKMMRRHNPLSVLSRWKLLDNLRRSVTPAALTALLLTGWMTLDSAWFWTCAILVILLLSTLFTLVLGAMRKPEDTLLRQHVAVILHSAGLHLLHKILDIVLLPYEAYYSCDAIIRTQWRVLVSHRQLLQWHASDQTNKRAGNSLLAYCKSMWISPVLSLATTAYLLWYRPWALMFAMPILVLWLIAPGVAYWVSRPILRQRTQLTQEQTQYLTMLSRKIWLFFETHVGPDDHWLPPDNVQDQPIEAIAHRTSPTNIGLSLLANLSAYDFGYITVGKLLQRTRYSFSSMALLARYRGHFYNWYDTQTLKPLLPMYISTVDSGNLAGHLLVLRSGLNALQDTAILGTRLFPGIQDTYGMLSNVPEGEIPARLRQFGRILEAVCLSVPHTLSAIHDCLVRLNDSIEGIDAGSGSEPDDWIRILRSQCREALDEVYALAPWVKIYTTGAWEEDFPMLGKVLNLRQLARLHTELIPVFDRRIAQASDPRETDFLNTLSQQVQAGSRNATDRMLLIEQLMTQSEEFAQMEYAFLYDPATYLLSIGYNVDERRRDAGSYDLLASEARLAVFIAVAQGQLSQASWFAMGRQLTIAGGDPILLSWSGSMFEYLMPLLVMPTFDNTLLDQTYHSVVERQIAYGMQRGVRWGISESGYNNFDAGLHYQYRAFGVPGLGFKRGLGDDLVIAPYASMLALMVMPQQACANLQQMSADGFEGKFGFYEAIDYTPSRLVRGQTNSIVRSFMVHHQGMGLLSLAYLLLDRPMQKRFESDPLFQAAMSLLHERIPKATAVYSNTTDLADIRVASDTTEMQMRVLTRPDSRTPEVQLLSNGRYHLMVTSAGGSYSRWYDLAITRWREDSTRDHWGTFCYVRDDGDGHYWSTAYQPTLAKPKTYEVVFSEGRAEFHRSDNSIDMHTEIVVSPEDDIELRRITITNRSRVKKTIEITSYAEVVLAPIAADTAHPAFSNLFVQTEIDRGRRAILCTRRPRSEGETMPWMFHLMAAHGVNIESVSYETDRMKFIGRGNTVACPQAMSQAGSLSDSDGSVLDPIVAMRYRMTLAVEQEITIDMVTGIGTSRDMCIELIEKYQDRYLADRVLELSWTHNQVVLRQLNASEADAQLYGRLANSIIYVNPLLRAEASMLGRNQRGQSALWSYAISGDLPIVLVQIKDINNIELVRQLVQAHAYWRSKGLAVDLVIWNEDHAGYRQVLQEQIMGLISSVTGMHAIDRPGGIFVRWLDQISDEDRVLFQSVASIILTDSRGSLAEQLNRRDPVEIRIPLLVPEVPLMAIATHEYPVLTQPALTLFNGIGGFSKDGREYVIVTSEEQRTPAPWVNVMANAHFGTVVSESGQAYSWGENAHEFRLTPWENDPVTDNSGEALYIRDEQSGSYWSPTPLPKRGKGEYVTRHGFGYSVFEHIEDGIFSELTVYVAVDASVKYSVLRIRNDSSRRRVLSATGYVEWVLADLRAKSAMHIVTENDPATGALLARNRYNTEFVDRVAFFDVDVASRTVSCDRSEFIGRNRSLRAPAALDRVSLSGKVGAGLDPCAAMQVKFDLASGQERELVFMLGMVDSRDVNIVDLVQRSRGTQAAKNALDAVHAYWDKTLGVIQIDTPDPALNVLANGWLMYQTIACRIWARSGYYQSGGAFGFRDQLQDAMALIHCEPDIVRQHLLRCAAHQFVEGDVQHWWHPPMDRGVRTHCSDDYLWLPLAVHHYVIGTGDMSVLDEMVHFIEGRPVRQDEDSYYDLPRRSIEEGTLYQHCIRAIEHGLKFGVHGLPLIGSCDWNDGMDKVGAQGKGESIWLGFFLYDVLMSFSVIATRYDDEMFAAHCRDEAVRLQKNIEQHGWDGEWYRRAYFDDGTPLGSAENTECRIDSISQSWSVLSGAGLPERSNMAMQAVNRDLVRNEDGIIQLLNPPFDRSGKNPGYIRGYVPGVRENGGQYTHAAIWVVMACAKMGDHRRAWELLRMINPVNHGKSVTDIARYKVEPYVVAADVYAVSPHMGRGGWTWYTGSAGWMYRLIVGSLLGLTVKGNMMTMAPCLAPDWDTYVMHYRYHDTQYTINVSRGHGETMAQSVMLDGNVQENGEILLVDDKHGHVVDIVVYMPVS